MRIDDLRRVLIVGAGGIGRQIAISCVTHGYAVSLHDIDPATLEATAAACRQAGRAALASNPSSQAAVESALNGVRAATDASEAGHDADLLIESVPERLPLKRQVFSQFAAICPAHTLFTTNTSVFLPSMFLAASGRPDKLASLHFLMDSDMIEIGPHRGTSPETVQLLKDFSSRIGHVSVVCKREQPGLLVNTMVMALNNAALTLAANGVADPEDIDRAWMKATHERRGPFGLLDLVGLKTSLEIAEYGARVTGSSQMKKNAKYLRKVVDEGRLGMQSGQGFYTYPDPAFRHPDFLKAD